MALALTIGGVTQTSYIKHQSMTLKFNTFDLALQNPATVPAVGDAVALTDTGLSWSGTVASVQITDTVERGTNKLVSIAATNEDTAGASAASFGLSDVPNNSTTYGYSHLTTKTTVDRDGNTTTTGSLTTYHFGIWPAQTFALTSANRGYSAQSFTAQNVTVTWPKAGVPICKIDFGDPIVTMSVWMNSSLSGQIDTTKITDGSVTTPKLAANAVTSEKIEAGTITADLLASELLLASLIKTADSGTRVEIDSAGVRAYSSSEDLLVNIPTDGSAVYVNGQIEATSLTVTGNAVLQGTGNSLAQSSVTTIDSYQQPPSQAPSLAYGYESGPTLDAIDSPTGYRGHGYYDSAGGASGSTACFVQAIGQAASGTDKWDIIVNEWNWSTGALDRQTTLGTITGTNKVSTSPPVPSITRLGTSWYVVTKWNGNLLLCKYTRSSGAFSTSIAINGDFSGYDPFGTAISTDGTDVFVPGGSATNALRICRYNTSLVKQATIELTEPTFTGNSLGWPANYVISNISGANRHYIGLQHKNSGVVTGYNVYDFHISTGALGSNTEFPAQAITGDNQSWYPLVYDGTNFWQRPAKEGPFNKFTNWTWTTASAKYWVGYSWYDSAGTTHETTVSPRASITHKKRAQLTVTTAALPGAGGADDPNNRRIYMFPNSSAPATTSLKLQSTSSSASATLTDYNSGGAAPQTSNGFSTVGTPAQIVSAGGSLLLRGDGHLTASSIKFGQVTITPTPGSPTSTTVTGLTVTGSNFYGFATANTTVIGSVVLGAAVSSVSSTGATIWVYRSNSTDTNVNWLIMGV